MKSKKTIYSSLILLSLIIIFLFLSPKTVEASSSTLNTSQGIMIDLGRHPMDKGGIEKIITVSAQRKMNYVQLHLADNENLSFQSKYLKNQSSKTVLSLEDLKELVTFANNKNVELIPDVDFPSHSGGNLISIKNFPSRHLQYNKTR